MGHRELKKPKLNKGKKIGEPSGSKTTKDESFDYPIYCFKHLDAGYGMNNCNQEEKAALISQLTHLCKMTWNDIKLADKHGMGSEKIDRNAIRAKIPAFITKDVDFFLAFRFKGKAPFVGHRSGSVLHVLYIDSKFTLYDHGS